MTMIRLYNEVGARVLEVKIPPQESIPKYIVFNGILYQHSDTSFNPTVYMYKEEIGGILLL